MSSFDSALNLKKFKSCRDETVPRQVIGRILEAGRHAPSPGNVQTLEFIVVESDSALEKLAEVAGDSRIKESSFSVIVISDINRMREKVGSSNARSSSMAEAAFAVENMRLVANENELASVLVSGFSPEEIGRKFDIPQDKTALMAASFGYTDDPVITGHKFSLNQICYYDTYGSQIKSAFDSSEWRGVKEEKRVYDKKAKGLKDKLKRKIRKVL